MGRIEKIIAKEKRKKKKEEKREQLKKRLAYRLWESANKPSGTDKKDWRNAEELLKEVHWIKRYFKSTIKKINLYILIGIFISVSSLAALLIHLGYFPLKGGEQIRGEQIKSEQIKSEQIKFDPPALILFFLFLTPFFSMIFEKATLPGGWNLEFRKIKERQYIQSKEIDNLNFLLLHFITSWEKEHLRGLNSSNRFKYEYKQIFEEELKRLLALELIERHPGKGIRSFKNDNRSNNDLKEHFYITDKGKDYLARIERFDKDEE